MRFLITGFAPFGKSKTNPSYEAVRRLPDMLGDHKIFRAQLPVAYDTCAGELLSLWDRYQPDCILCLGQAAGREGISLEHTAVNVKASGMPDSTGVTYSGEKILSAGPDSLNSNLPLKELAGAMREVGIPVKISYSAGTYVCNNLFYHMLYHAAQSPHRMLCGFIHIPPDESQMADFAPGTPFMPVAEVVRALKTAVAFLGGL